MTHTQRVEIKRNGNIGLWLLALLVGMAVIGFGTWLFKDRVDRQINNRFEAHLSDGPHPGALELILTNGSAISGLIDHQRIEDSRFTTLEAELSAARYRLSRVEQLLGIPEKVETEER
jgi:hypothetical protein